jgi:WD40 repeat protein
MTGRLSQPAVVLKGHAGTVFGATFLESPFRPGTIVTGAYLDRSSRGEIKMWLPSRGIDISNAAAHASTSTASLEVDAKEEITKSGILSLYQLHGTPQIACTTFESGVHILRAKENIMEDQDQDDYRNNCDSSSIQRGKRKKGMVSRFSMRDEENPSVPSYSFYPVLEILGQHAPCAKVFVDKNSRILAIPSYDGAVRLYRLPDWITNSTEPERGDDDLRTSTREASLQPGAVWLDDEEIEITENGVTRTEKHMAACALTMSDDSQFMMTGGNDMQVKLWNMQSESITTRFHGHTGWVWNIKALDPFLHVAMSSSTDGFCRQWDTRSGGCVGKINVSAHGPGHVFPVTGVALRGNAWHMAVGSMDKSVYVLDCRMMKKLYTLGQHEDRVCRAMIHEDTLMTTGWDHSVRLWDFK